MGCPSMDTSRNAVLVVGLVALQLVSVVTAELVSAREEKAGSKSGVITVSDRRETLNESGGVGTVWS